MGFWLYIVLLKLIYAAVTGVSTVRCGTNYHLYFGRRLVSGCRAARALHQLMMDGFFVLVIESSVRWFHLPVLATVL